MWVKCQNGDLVNLDNIVSITKESRTSGLRVVAVGGRNDDDFYVLADKLTNENADALIRSIGSCLDNGEVTFFSVSFELSRD